MSEINENIITEENTVAESVTQQEAEAFEPQAQAKIKKIKKAPIIALICVIAAVIGVVAFVFGSGKSEADPLFYTDSGALYMKNLSKSDKEPVKIFAAEDKDSYISDVILNSEKTELLFSSYDESDEGQFATVYSYNLTTPDVAPVKTAEKVCSFVKNEESGVLTCTVGKKSKLVQYDAQLKETVIAKEVDYFVVSSDGLRMVYTLKDGGVYLKQTDKDATQISKKGELVFQNDELTTLYVLEDESLYKVQATGEKELIDEGVASASFVNADGYYFKTVKNFLLKDLFEDDMLESDNDIKIPTETGTEEYKLYSQKVIRDNIRTLILNPETVFEIQNVYYYDGTESKLVIENAFEGEADIFADSGENAFANLFCSVVDTDEIKKVLMSDVWKIVSNLDEDISDGIDEITAIISEPFIDYSKDYFVYKGDFASPVGIKGMVYDRVVDYANKNLYLSISEDAEGKSTLYKFPITENGLGESEVICESVSVYSTEVTEDGKLFYVEDIYPEEGEEVSLGGDIVSKVYFDSKLVAENVSNVFEKDLEKGIILMEKYKLKEDGTPDFEEYPYDAVFYSAETGEELPLTSEEEDEGYYSLFETFSGKMLLLKENYVSEEVVSDFYLVENGTLKDLKFSMITPEHCSYMNELRDGSGYFDWDSDWEDIFDF